jgi:diguanylate cyclase (GGDEF)-like protein
MAGKLAASLIYATALAFYLPRAWSSERQVEDPVRPGLGALFQVLTYRQRYEALRAQAVRDPLTGVHNRGFFDEMLAVQVAQSRRGGAPVTVMLADIDHFKRINDAYGHPEGDRALKVIADALVGAVRGSDVVCRYGGEEFCIVLPATSIDAAVPLAARVREAVPAACARAGVSPGSRVTVTIGVASCPQDGSDADAVMRAADRRLYRGKEAGRDRVVAAA